ncbi:STAS domain-containing protein [Hydrocarboniphaga sp.]|uniref:STAS domain-containing protein n=1 Tax=Hydrocarboniphaga sp. TaxID=2033016 RepID=UPI003D129A18
MPRTRSSKQQPATPISLGADLGIELAPALQAELAQRLEQREPVQINASEVRRVHTAALQLFCLFCRDRREAGRAVEFLMPSESLRQAASLLGASTLLQISQQAA